MEEFFLCIQSWSPSQGLQEDSRGRQAHLMLFMGGSSVYIPGDVPVMASDLSPRCPLIQLLLGQWTQVLKFSALETVVPSEPDIFSHYPLLSLDHKSKAKTLASLSSLNKRLY